MTYAREKVEEIVIGTLLNESGDDMFYEKNKASLRRELFQDKKKAFVFDVIEKMIKDGKKRTMPSDVLNYCEEKEIKYGNVSNFALFMCKMAESYAFIGFKGHVKSLVQYFLKDKKYGEQ